MNFRPIMLFLIAALMLLGVGASALAAENVETKAEEDEISYASCYVNARLKFKDGKGGCLQNNRYFSNIQGVKNNLTRNNFNLALSLNPAQCPATFGWSYGNLSTYVSICEKGLQEQIGSKSDQCECKPVEDIAKNLSKAEFYEFEKAYASRRKTKLSKSDLSNLTPVAKSPPIPEGADEERRQKDALAKAGNERNQQVALAEAENLRLTAELSKLNNHLQILFILHSSPPLWRRLTVFSSAI